MHTSPGPQKYAQLLTKGDLIDISSELSFLAWVKMYEQLDFFK
jgi:hypothetical protein